MDILKQLSKQNNKWQAYALKICNDSELASDLVQEMYLKFHRNKYTRTDAGYVYWAIKNLYRDTFRNNLQTISIDELLYLRIDGDDGDEFRFNRNIDKILKCEDYDKKNHVTIHLNIKKIKNSLLEDQEVKEVYLSLK